MATTPARIARLLKNVRMHLPSVIDDALKIELYNALDEFLKDSNVWQEEIPVSVVADDDEYEISPQADGVINRLISLVDENDIPVKATMAVPGTLVLETTPTVAATYTATVALTVIDPVDSSGYPRCEDWILDKYALDIVDGVVSRLMMQPAKPYTNERLAIYHGRRFRAAIATARAEAARKNLYNAQNWRFPAFTR